MTIIKKCTATLVLTALIASVLALSGMHVCAADDNQSPTDLPFTDIDKDDWFYNDVSYAWYLDVMNGISSDLFAPDMAASRAIIVTFLWRLAGKPTSGSDIGFNDVDDSSWYAEPVRWAAENNIVLGYGDGTFGADDCVTREQMAVLLYRYVKSTGGGFSDRWTFELDYVDAADIADYSYEAICWMTMNGIIGGLPGDVLDPRGEVTRAQVAAILHRFSENVIKQD